ncbi:hypothetical protein [Microbacterium sp. BK668]|uniref:hypothetical protein n=1 Tax=Microbacterium sp. BK668 TaxID=2512118 RepID=UPI00106220CC|nr:hypothetical protein [Microbacterium sp. BK668]TDN88379.1 LGFP repeat-containing protein [Microbacterium sp. BK668]
MRKPWTILLIGVLAVASLAAAAPLTPAAASPARAAVDAAVQPAAAVVGFEAGNIIDDSVFFARGTMSAAQIQSFLNGKVPTCQAGYTCLKDFAQATTSRSADPMCAGYTGQGRESAAQIIYNVAQSCGINPQVLLVTLQKEQGLVTHTWPSDWRYTIAMGQGCPDTAACDTRYYGFFNQVYGAAWQFKRYANPPGTSQFFTWYAPGRTWNIQWHPNAGCGSSPVGVRNQATANLYYYTPYQPNAAALRAGFGEGDGCSSYGNRNFYNYFTAWFGSTRSLVGSAITDKYAQLGGSAGYLGAPVGATTCGLKDGGCFQSYRNGAIHWSPASGAHATTGAISASWASTGWENGPLGYPVNEQNCSLAGGTGCWQGFQKGEVHWSAASGAYGSWGPTLVRYQSMGSERSPLGFPTGSPACNLKDGGCWQSYQGGMIHWTQATGAHSTYGAFLTKWKALDSERGLGYPMSEQICGLKDGGCWQRFQSGLIHSTPAGMFATRGAILARWANLDYERGFGYPLGDQACGLKDGGCWQRFQGGLIHWTAATGAFSTRGPILAKWASLDYERGLGYPTSEQMCGLKDGGCWQRFQGGLIHWTQGTGAVATRDAILAEWASLDYERGLGYPTADQRCGLKDGGCIQTFQSGPIVWSPTGGAHAVTGSIGEVWKARGAETGALGYPRTDLVCGLKDGACYQGFAGGLVHSVPALGTFITTGRILEKWAISDYERGPYGYPTSDQSCTGETCSQQFQGGTLTAP